MQETGLDWAAAGAGRNWHLLHTQQRIPKRSCTTSCRPLASPNAVAPILRAFSPPAVWRTPTGCSSPHLSRLAAFWPAPRGLRKRQATPALPCRSFSSPVKVWGVPCESARRVRVPVLMRRLARSFTPFNAPNSHSTPKFDRSMYISCRIHFPDATVPHGPPDPAPSFAASGPFLILPSQKSSPCLCNSMAIAFVAPLFSYSYKSLFPQPLSFHIHAKP